MKRFNMSNLLLYNATPEAHTHTRGATDYRTHGSDRITVLRHGSDHFSDHQKKKKKRRETNITLFSIYSV